MGDLPTPRRRSSIASGRDEGECHSERFLEGMADEDAILYEMMNSQTEGAEHFDWVSQLTRLIYAPPPTHDPARVILLSISRHIWLVGHHDNRGGPHRRQSPSQRRHRACKMDRVQPKVFRWSLDRCRAVGCSRLVVAPGIDGQSRAEWQE